VDASG